MESQFRALADPIRLQILQGLVAGEAKAGDIAARFAVTRPAVSHHLKVLRDAGLIRVRREAQARLYSIDRKGVAGFRGCFATSPVAMVTAGTNPMRDGQEEGRWPEIMGELSLLHLAGPGGDADSDRYSARRTMRPVQIPKPIVSFVLAASACCCAPGAAPGEPNVPTDGAAVEFRPRVIHTTDLGADPDDEMSMVRHLVMSNLFDTEGLIVSTGCWKKRQDNTGMLDRLVDAYDQVDDNLRVHDAAFPSADRLRSVTVMGQRGYGMADVGDGRDSAGSELIISAVDKNDPRPLWVTCWGGCNTVAQALWKVRAARSDEGVAEFVSRLRVYDVLGQDDAGAWIAGTFPDITYIRATRVFDWQPSDGWVDTHVQSHGPLGAVYPDAPYAYEGDSPAIFHLIPNGLHDPELVDQGGWGGRFGARKTRGVRGMSCMAGEEARYDPYGVYTDATESIARWKEAIQNDFEARMDWSVTGDFAAANHHPIAVLNGDPTRRVLKLVAETGSVIELSAAGSSDPDGDELSYSWWHYREPGSYDGDVEIRGSRSGSASVRVPSDAGGDSIHIVLEVEDDGSPSLTAYRRIVVTVL